MKRFLTLSTLVLACGTALLAGPEYLISVDTSGLGSVGGYIDLAFDKANSDALGATATITGFTSTGFTFSGSNSSTGGVTGSLDAPPLVIANDGGAANFYDEGVTSFGSEFSLLVDFDGPAIGEASLDVSDFFVSLLDGDGNFIGGDPVTGAVADITIGTDGNLTAQTTANASASGVPEPATLLTGGFGALLLFAVRRRRSLAGQHGILPRRSAASVAR
jgi:hypothetical protein